MGNKLGLTIDKKLSINTFCLTFAWTDRIRIIMAPAEIVDLSEKIIFQFWKVQESKRSEGLAEYKLKDSPLNYTETTSEESFNFKHLICTLIKSYYETGWHLEASLCLNQSNTSQIIFTKKQPTQTQIAMVSLYLGNTISVIGPESMQAAVKQAVSSSWPNGINKELNTSTQTRQSHVIHLNQSDHYNSPELICSIFKSAESLGWNYVSSIQKNQKSSLLFRYEPDEIEQGDYFALILDRNDKINILSPPAGTIDAIKGSINAAYDKGIQKEGAHLNTHEFTLNGNPWLNQGENVVHSKRLINQIIDDLKSNQYDLHAICDTLTLYSKFGTFFFKKCKNQEKNSPRAKTLTLGFSLSKIIITDDLNNFSELVREALSVGWDFGSTESSLGGALEFRLNGVPLISDPDTPDTIGLVLFMLVLFDRLDGFSRFKFLTSGDLNDSHNLKFTNTHSLLFQYNA